RTPQQLDGQIRATGSESGGKPPHRSPPPTSEPGPSGVFERPHRLAATIVPILDSSPEAPDHWDIEPPTCAVDGMIVRAHQLLCTPIGSSRQASGRGARASYDSSGRRPVANVPRTDP